MSVVINKLVYGIELGNTQAVTEQYKRYCKESGREYQYEGEYEDNDERSHSLFNEGVPFGDFLLVCTGSTALLCKTAVECTDLNDDKGEDEDEFFFSWTLNRLNDEAAATLQRALNQAAEVLTQTPQHNSLKVVSLVTVV